MAAGSQTPLTKKLGIRPRHAVVLLGAPEALGAELEPLPEGAVVRESLPDEGDVDVVVLFCQTEERLDRELPRIARRLAPAGGLWVAWPKRSSGVPTDLGFDAVQRAGLDRGLVDNKVCAVNEVFTGLRFVVRREDREAWAMGRRGAS